ncbi:MAG: ATP-binding protein [Haliscomenobacter sp.]|uniref:sensor histidine kinase n=1 Tax=Haliscomenobacter sp. TaxID=2717303 RepID=UPI0029B2A7D4|nr:ATP-binding protein [Haliscomenobacter sp.]MDX2072451.1 ATP-binding protein [Haliscomenobacter sp.]
MGKSFCIHAPLWLYLEKLLKNGVGMRLLKNYSMIFSTFIFLLFAAPLCAQQRQLSVKDSLVNALRYAESDRTRVDIYAKLADFRIGDWSQVLEFAQKGHALAQKIGYKKGQMECDVFMAFRLVHIDVFKSITLLLEAKQWSEENGETKMLITSLTYLGYAYNSIDFKKSITYYKEAWRLMILHKLDDESSWPIYAPIGYAYKDAGILDTAMLFLRKGYELSFNGKAAIKPNSYYRHFAEIFYRQNKRDSALYYLYRSLAEGQLHTGEVYYYLARIKKDFNQLDSAKYYAKAALAEQIAANRNEYIILSANFLYGLYKNTDSIQALRYRLIAFEAKDKFFPQEKAREVERFAFEERERAAEAQRRVEAIQARNRFNILLVILVGIALLTSILYRNNRQKQTANALLQSKNKEVQQTLSQLQSTQAQLIQSEKLASLGELTAGIAHEIQNPLNFVNNFAEVSAEMLDELKEELEKGDIEEVKAIAEDLQVNLGKINHHGGRASSIVKGMLEHSRTSTGVKELTNLNALADEFLRLAYHGLRAKDSSFNATMEMHFDPDLPLVSVIPQDIGRVLLNLINNAFYAVQEKARQGIEGFAPTVSISTKKMNNAIEIRVKDNGNGIPEAIRDKIFQPFFTTKPTGQGTGLGLSLTYDIITKGHGGKLHLESTENQGSTFTIELPLINPKN